MRRLLKLGAIALFALLIIVPAASAQRGFVGRGGFYGGRGFYGGWYGRGWGWYYPWGWYGYGPYDWGYPYAYGYGSAAPIGEVKILKVPNDTQVYVDGGFAGTVGDLKKFRLHTGHHDIELRDHSGHALQQERIEVISGKTIEIHGNTGGH